MTSGYKQTIVIRYVRCEKKWNVTRSHRALIFSLTFPCDQAYTQANTNYESHSICLLLFSFYNYTHCKSNLILQSLSFALFHLFCVQFALSKWQWLCDYSDLNDAWIPPPISHVVWVTISTTDFIELDFVCACINEEIICKHFINCHLVLSYTLPTNILPAGWKEKKMWNRIGSLKIDSQNLHVFDFESRTTFCPRFTLCETLQFDVTPNLATATEKKCANNFLRTGFIATIILAWKYQMTQSKAKLMNSFNVSEVQSGWTMITIKLLQLNIAKKTTVAAAKGYSVCTTTINALSLHSYRSKFRVVHCCSTVLCRNTPPCIHTI